MPCGSRAGCTFLHNPAVSRYLVTSALPYANGPLHFGHVCGAYLPADVYVRTLRAQGEEVLYVCGTDEHGVAITIRAEAEGTPYAEYVAHWRDAIRVLFAALGIEFDVFSGTSVCPWHVETCQEFFRDLKVNGYLDKRSSEQLFCVSDDRFLADRYVEGTCPECGFGQARGDECPRCGSWLDPLRFTDPRCRICGQAPEKRTTTHWYLDMPKLRDEYIGRWIGEHEWKANVASYIKNMLENVPPRAITRDMRWGVPLPEDLAEGETGKVLYVWFDAPIGYISFTKEWAAERGAPDDWERWWKDPETRLVQFIGKDNIPFHCMLFPAMLFGAKAGWILPWQVPANEFYNLQGDKFSTSGGWFIPLEEFFQRYDPEVARFHLLLSSPETADSEWRWQDFQRTANSALAGTIGNLATRVLKFIQKNCGGVVPRLAPEHEAEMDRVLFEECGAFGDPAEHVRAFRFRRAAEQLVANAVLANVFVDRLAPWSLQKSDPERAASALATLCDWLALIARWMAPFLPGKAQALWAMLGQTGPVHAAGWPELPRPGAWRNLRPLTPLGEVGALFARIDDAAVAAEVAALEARRASAPP